MRPLTLLFSVLVCGAVSLAAALPPAEPQKPTYQLSNEIETHIRLLVSSEAIVGRFTVHGDDRQKALDTFTDYARSRLHTTVYFVPLTKDTGHMLQGLASCPLTLRGRVCVILIDTSVNKANGQLSTLLHEIAHVGQGDHVKTTLEAELWAETIAWLVQRELGFNTTRESLSYLYLIPEDVRRRFLSEKEPEIRKVVERLVKVGKKA